MDKKIIQEAIQAIRKELRGRSPALSKMLGKDEPAADESSESSEPAIAEIILGKDDAADEGSAAEEAKESPDEEGKEDLAAAVVKRLLEKK